MSTGDRQGLMSTSCGIARFYGINFVVFKMKVNVLISLYTHRTSVIEPPGPGEASDVFLLGKFLWGCECASGSFRRDELEYSH